MARTGESNRLIEPFRSALTTYRTGLDDPEKIYGRERETRHDESFLDRVVATSTCELLHRSAYSGIAQVLGGKE